MTATTTTAEEAIGAIRTGDTVMVGGFGLVGAPLTLIDALVEHSDATELTIVSNNIGEPGRGLGKLLRQGRIRRGISSYFTSNPEAVAAVNAGEIEATLVPQGTFAEAIRAAGPDRLRERALRDERRLDLAGVDRRDRLGVRREVRGDAAADPALAQELAEAAAGLADVVRDDGEVARVRLLDERVDQRQRRADQPEAADHDRVAAADGGDRLRGRCQRRRHRADRAS